MPIAFGTVYREPLLSGDAGVEQTIALMRELVDEALRDPSIIRLAADIVRGVPAFNDYAEANALYEWVRSHIRFTKDPVNKEKLYPPAELLKIRAGDCDDISMLLSTLLMAVGYPARLMTIAAPGSPDQFSHVYVEAEVPPGSGQWVAVDPARADSQFGVPPPITTRARWWSLVDSSYGDLSGMRFAGSTSNLFGRPVSNLGNYPRFRSHVSGMGAYGKVRTMGDTAPSGSSTSSTIATIEQGTADIIRASEGIPASPFAYQSGPWSSFATAYTPGATMPPAGYSYNAAGQLVPTASLSVSGSSNWVLWLALGFGALLLVGGGRR